jgi:hypothetical protein
LYSIQTDEKLDAVHQRSRQITVDHTPNVLITDDHVLVGERVAKADDLQCLINLFKQLFKQFHLSPGKLGKRLTNEDEPPLIGGVIKATPAVVVDADVIGGHLDGAGSIHHIAEKGPWITLHQSAASKHQSRGVHRDCMKHRPSPDPPPSL